MQFLSKLGLSQGGVSQGWAARLTAAAPTLLAVVLVVAIAAQLALLMLKFLAPPSDAPVTVAPQAAAGPNLANIVNAHLFGSAAVEASGDAASAPTTSLRLTLAGTLAGSDPAQGWAIIGESAQNTRLYATGASIAGGATLREVYADRAILERGGRLEALLLPRLSGAAASAAPIAYGNQAAAQQSLADSVRTLVQKDPGAISNLIRPQPVFAGGQQKGYRLYPGRNRAQFASIGLMPGDLVTAVNGSPLDDPNTGLATLRGIGAGGSVTLTIERNGSEQQLTVDVAAAMAAMPSDDDSQVQADPDDSE
jgi:general secretion pathway protein C